MSDRLIVGRVPQGEINGDALRDAVPLTTTLKANSGTVTFRVYAFDMRGAAILPPTGGTTYFALSVTATATGQTITSVIAAAYAGYVISQSDTIGFIITDVASTTLGAQLWYNFSGGRYEPDGTVGVLSPVAGSTSGLDTRYLPQAGRSAGLTRTGGRCIVSFPVGTNHFNSDTVQNNTFTSYQSRVGFVIKYACVEISALYAAYLPGGTGILGEQVGGKYWQQGSWQPEGALGPSGQSAQGKEPMFFGQKTYQKMFGKLVTVSDPWEDYVARADERVFVWTDAIVGLKTAPAAPTLDVSGGTGLTGTWALGVSYVNPASGDEVNESNISAYTSTGAISNKAIGVVSPIASTGWTHYNVYCTRTSGTITGRSWKVNTKPQPLGVDYPAFNVIPNAAAETEPGSLPKLARVTGSATIGNYGGGPSSIGVDAFVANTTGTISVATKTVYCPMALIGQPAGVVGPILSGVSCGDSIPFGTGATLYGYGINGYPCQAMRTNGIPHATLARGGETLTNVITNGAFDARMRIARWATFAINTYGTNDLPNSVTLPQFQVRSVRFDRRFTRAGIVVMFTTILPRITTTDFGTTIGSQSDQSGTGNSTTRVAWNTFNRSVVTGSTATSYTETLGTGNGVLTAFEGSTAFLIGSEVITTASGVAAGPSAATPAYYYTETGGEYASGVTFLVAPSAGPVTIAALPIPGRAAASSSAVLAICWDICAPIEANTAGVLTQNGSRVLPAGQIAVNFPGDATVVGVFANASGEQTWTFTVSGASWTTDQYAGGQLYITAGVNVGVQSLAINSNTGTVITGFGSVTNGNVTGYQIATGTLMLGDGTHPAQTGHATIAASFPLVALQAAVAGTA